MKLIKPRANLKTAPKGEAVYLIRKRAYHNAKDHGPWTLWSMFRIDPAVPEQQERWKPTEGFQRQFIGPCDLEIPKEPELHSVEQDIDAPTKVETKTVDVRPEHMMVSLLEELVAHTGTIITMIHAIQTAPKAKPGPILVDKPSTPVREEIVAPAAEEKPSRPDPVELGPEDLMPENVKQTWLAMFQNIKMLPIRVEETMQSKMADWKVKDIERLKAIYAKYSGSGKAASYKKV